MSNRQNRTGLFEMPNQPELPDLFLVALREAALQLRTHSVARVVAYDPATQTASLSGELLQVVKDLLTTPTPANPNPTNIQEPVLLQGIKVAWPTTAAGYLTFPLVPGDTGELHVQDRSIDQWRATGIPSDPVSAFIHMLGDSVFHPNIRPDANPIVPPTSLVATVLEGPLVHLGRLAVEPVLKGATVATAFTAYTTAVAAAGTAHAAIIPPTAISNAAFITALVTATAVLAGTIAAWPSIKVFTE